MIKRDDLIQQFNDLSAKKEREGASFSSVDDLRMRNLRLAASLMAFRGVEEIHSIGNFVKEGVTLPTAGERIIIPKGAIFHTMYPGKDYESYTYNRQITVHSVTPANATGFHENYRDDPSSTQELAIEIMWSGTGGYWNRMKLNEWIEHGGIELTQQLQQKKQLASELAP